MRSDPFLLFHAVQRHTAARCEILRGRGFIQRERVGAGLPEVRSVRRADRNGLAGARQLSGGDVVAAVAGAQLDLGVLAPGGAEARGVVIVGKLAVDVVAENGSLAAAEAQTIVHVVSAGERWADNQLGETAQVDVGKVHIDLCDLRCDRDFFELHEHVARDAGGGLRGDGVGVGLERGVERGGHVVEVLHLDAVGFLPLGELVVAGFCHASSCVLRPAIRARFVFKPPCRGSRWCMIQFFV